MLDIWTILILIALGGIIFALGVLLGAFVMFKGKSTQPNEKFLGGQAKGEIFSIPDVDDLAEFPGEPSKDEEHILKKTGEFLKTLSGGK
jgi:hypothetical protein